MTSVSATQARAKLNLLIDEAAGSHEPVQIKGRHGNAVLIAEDDWRSIQETLHLLSVPGMRDSIVEGMGQPLDEASTLPGW